MEKKRKGLLVLVLLLVAAIGVGFAAALTDTITLNGTATALASDFDIQWNTTHTPTVTPTGTSATGTGTYTSADVATLSVSGLKAKGDKVVAVFQAKNASSELNADISAAVTTDITDTTHYSVSVSGGGSNVAPNGTADITVTVELIQAFSDSTTAAASKTFTVTVTGTAAE